MQRVRLALVLLCLSLSAAQAEGWRQIGYGRLINNDFLGDLQDRGQSGSYVSSRILSRKNDWGGSLPSGVGELLEFRLQADIKAPDDLTRPAAGDRPFAGSVSFGLHTHYEHQSIEVALGAELVAVGPMTGLDQFQTGLHDFLRVPPLSAKTRGGQIRNGVHPGVVVEMGRTFRLSERTQLRPFTEARYGAETLVRAGVDLVIGEVLRGEMMLRDGITGQRYRAEMAENRGLALVFGADTAVVSDSIYLPGGRGYVLSDRRNRARLGLHWETARLHGFFGVTFLGREYTSQGGEQVVGSIRLGLKF